MAEDTFHVGVISGAVAASRNHLTLHNADAAKVVKVYRVTAAGAPTAAVVGLVVPLHVARFVGAAPSTGTAVTPVPAARSGAALPNTITAKAGPTTVAGTEAVPFGIGTVTGEEAGAPATVELYRYTIDGTRPVELAQGEGIVIAQGALAIALGAVSLVVTFSVV